MDIQDIPNDFTDFILNDIKKSLDEGVKKGNEYVKEVFTNKYAKEPIDTELLMDSTKIVKKDNLTVDIVVTPNVYTPEIKIKSKYLSAGYGDESTTLDSAEAVIYALGESNKYGKRDFPADIEEEFFKDNFE